MTDLPGDALVSADWLAGALGARDLRVLDCSWFLPGDGVDAAAAFAAGHVPGAAFLDLGELVDTAAAAPMMLPPPEKFASRVSALGVGDGCRIVLYDASPHHSAARAWVMFRSFGIPDVAILDGGLAAWRAAGQPIETGTPPPPRRRHLTPRTRGAGIADLAAVRARLDDGGAQIVDARSPARFAGTAPEPRAGVAPGHMPSAINLPHGALFDADGRWLRGDALRAAFAAAGIDPARPVIATCGSGVTASVIAFGLHLLGQEAAVYDGSWAEWGADPATPKATGVREDAA